MNTSDSEPPRRRIGRSAWVLAGFIAIAAYFLFSEHRAHFAPYLPFVLLAACPLLHLFHGHGGHGRPGDHGGAPGAPGSGAPHRPPPGDRS